MTHNSTAASCNLTGHARLLPSCCCTVYPKFSKTFTVRSSFLNFVTKNVNASVEFEFSFRTFSSEIIMKTTFGITGLGWVSL